MKKYIFNYNLSLCFFKLFLFMILLYIVPVTMYIATPDADTYKAVLFDRALLMMENVVCAFALTIVFGLIIYYEERKIKSKGNCS